MSQTNNESKPINVRLQQLEMLLADANIARMHIRLSNLEDLLQEANNRIYVLENICQSNGIVLHQAEEQVSSDDEESVDSGVVDSDEEEDGYAKVFASGEQAESQYGCAEVGVWACGAGGRNPQAEPQYGGRGAEPPNEFTRNDDFIPVSYYEEDEEEDVPEMITIQFANSDEVQQFPSASYCRRVSSIPEDGHIVQAIPMCMHEQDMRLYDDTCYPVLCAEEEEEEEEEADEDEADEDEAEHQDGGWGAEPPEFPWNSQLLENGDLLYGTCSDEYEKYYSERTAAFQAAIDDANDCSAFYQFKALDKARNNELDAKIAKVLLYEVDNEEDQDDVWQRSYGNEDDEEEEDDEHDY